MPKVVLSNHARMRFMRRKKDRNLDYCEPIIVALEQDSVDWPRCRSVKIDLTVDGKNFHCILEPTSQTHRTYIVKTVI